MRTSPTQLPSYTELCQILASEALRPIPTEREHIHYSDFTTIIDIELLKSYNLPTQFFEKDIQFEVLQDESLFAEVSSMFDNLVGHILSSQDDPSHQILFNNVYNYLSETDVPEQADLIFVFGSKATFRTQKAVKLYQDGLAPKILISGKGPFYQQDTTATTEAEILNQFAIQQGVPSESIILEKESITVPDNVKRSLNLVEKMNIPHKSIILVNSPFSQRRG